MKKLLLIFALAGAAWGQITLDTHTVTGRFFQANPSLSYTMTSGTHCILVAYVFRYSGSGITVTAATWNGVTYDGTGTPISGDPGIQYFYWLNPTSGTHTIAATLSSLSGTAGGIGAASACGVDQANPIDATGQSGPTATTTPSVTVTPVAPGTIAFSFFFAGTTLTFFGGGWSTGRVTSSSNYAAISDFLGPPLTGAQSDTSSGATNANWVAGAMTLRPDNLCSISESDPMAAGVNGTAYSQTVATTNCIGNSPTFTVDSGSLPHNLSINSSTGEISGTPDVTATSTFAIKVASTNGDFTKTLHISINDVAPVISALSITANSPSSALAVWTTDSASSSQVACGTVGGGPYTTYVTPEVYHESSGPGAGVTSHSMVITGLPTNTSGTAYPCVVKSRTPTSAVTTSGELTTGTLAAMTSTPIAVTLSPYYRYNDQYAGAGKACNMDSMYATMWADDGIVYMPGDDTSGCTASGGNYPWFGASGQNTATYNVTPSTLAGSSATIALTNRMTAFGVGGASNTNGWSDGATWKSGSGLSFHGNLLRVVHRQGGSPLLLNPSVTISSDHGATWLAPQNYPSGTPQANGDPPTGGNAMWSGNARCGTVYFAQHAQDYGGAAGQFAFVNYGNADGWVYGLCSKNNGDVGDSYLFRVRVEDILLLDGSKYQYYVSGDGLLDVNWTANLNSAGAVLVGYDSFAHGMDFIPDFNRWMFVTRRTWAGAFHVSILILDAPYPWGPYTVVGASGRDNAHVNYTPTFPSVMRSTYVKTSTSPLMGAIKIMTTGGDPGALTSNPAGDEYGPHWFEIALTERTSSPPRIPPLSYNGGKNVTISHGLDLWYPMQPLGVVVNDASVKDIGTGRYTVNLTARPQYDGRGMLDWGYWSGSARNCSPACESPQTYTLTTPYAEALGDFTLALVFAHYPDGGSPSVGANALTKNSNETVLDKTTAGAGIRIFRNGTTANSHKVTVGSTTSSAFTLPTDVQAGSGNFPMLFVRRIGSAVTVYRATGLTGLPLTTLASFSDANATDTAAMVLGTITGGTQAFYGTISTLKIWSRGLNDAELVQEAATIAAEMLKRGITVQ